MNFLTNLFTRSSPETSDPVARLLALAEKDLAARKEFYRAILEQELWVPGQIDETGVLIQPYTVHDKKTLLFYSTQEKLHEGLGEGKECFALVGHQLMEATASFEARILNYATDRAKEFTRTEVLALLDGTIFDALQGTTAATEGSRVFVLGQPKKYPLQLLEELKLLLAEYPKVASASIALMFDQQQTGSLPDYVVAFDTDMLQDDFQELVRKAQALATATGTMNIVFTDFTDDTIAEYMRSEVKPFYKIT